MTIALEIEVVRARLDVVDLVPCTLRDAQKAGTADGMQALIGAAVANVDVVANHVEVCGAQRRNRINDE